MFAEIAIDFCSRHSFDEPPSAPRPPGMAAAKISNSGSGDSVFATNSRPGKRHVHEMTEEQQLEAAIRASIGDDQDKEDMDSDEEMTNDAIHFDSDVVDASIHHDRCDLQEGDNKEMETVFGEEIAGMDVGEEPTENDGVAKVMIRMPDGKRLVRKFRVDDVVKKVYAFVAVSRLHL